MAFKGFNSILFDIDSLIDKELSVINLLMNANHNINIDRSYIKSLDDKTIKFKRMYSHQDLFERILLDESDKKDYISLMNKIYNLNEELILKKYAITTSIVSLLSAYRKAGNGVIKTTVRCDNEIQKSFIESLQSSETIVVKSRKDIDMSKYGRLYIGNYKSALEYVLNEPKSIIILNFKENFKEDNITILNPELIISLGDVNEIEISPAYNISQDLKG